MNKLFNDDLYFKPKLKIIKGWANLTPLVDIMFLLLIFFMLSSSFIQVSGVKVNLTEASQSGTRTVEKVVVTVDANNQCYINDELINDKNIRDKMVEIQSRYNHPDTIVIRADKTASVGQIAKLMILVQELEMNVFFATMPSQKKNTINSSPLNE